MNQYDSKFSFFPQISALAESAVKTFDPKSFVGSVFGGFIAQEVIHYTTKSIILKGVPAEGNYSKTVAIKLTTPTFQVLSGAEHHSRQAHYMEKLKNPNMVVIHSAGTENGVNYVVMEYLSNGDIVSFSKEKSIEDKILLFLDACKGVSYIHNKLVIHSDLKPKNILINSSGVPKIIDLDLSFALEQQFNDEFSYADVNGYTSDYASPEQLNGERPTIRSDVYSLSVILVEMLSGCTIDTEKYGLPPIENLSKNRARELSSIINKARSTNPANRYHSVKEFTHDLSVFCENRKIARPYRAAAPFYYKLFRIFKTNKLFISVSSSLFIALIVFLLVLIRQVNKAEESLFLMAKNHDVTSRNSKIFDEKGVELLNSTSLTQEGYYYQLIAFGDAYFSRGKPSKAINFFKKALTLYSNTRDEKHLSTLVKVADCYFAMNQYEEANVLFQPFLPTIFINKIDSPELAKMFISIIENNIRIDTWSYKGDDFKTPTEVADSIDLKMFSDVDTKLEVEISLHIIRATERYYNMYGDYASVVSFADEKEYKELILPNLKYSLGELLKAKAILDSSEHITHLEPKVYLWLSRIESEMGRVKESEKYYDYGMKKNIDVFGLEHPSTIEMLAMRYAMDRHTTPSKAFDTAQKLYDTVESINPDDVAHTAFYREILTEAYFIKGDYKGVIKSAKKGLHQFEVLRQEERNTVNVAATAHNLHWITLLEPVILSRKTSFFESALTLEKAYASIYPTEAFVPFIEMQFIMETGNTYEKIKAFESAYKFIELFFSPETRPTNREPFNIANMLLNLSQYCTKLPDCDPLVYLNKANEIIQWSEIQQRKSAYRLKWLIREMDVLLAIGKYKDVEKLMEENALLINNLALRDNLFYAIIYLFKSELAFHQGSQLVSKKYIEMAMPAIVKQFGTATGIYQRALNLFNEIDDLAVADIGVDNRLIPLAGVQD